MYAWSNDNETETEPTQSELEQYEFSSPLKSNLTLDSSTVGIIENRNTNTNTKIFATLTDLERSSTVSDNDLIVGDQDSKSRGIRKKAKKDESMVNAIPLSAGSPTDKIPFSFSTSFSTSLDYSKLEKEEVQPVSTDIMSLIDNDTNSHFTNPLFAVPSEVEDDKKDDKEIPFSHSTLSDPAPTSVSILSYVRPLDARTADQELNIDSNKMIEIGIEVEKKVEAEVETLSNKNKEEILESLSVKIVATNPFQPLLSIQSLPESFAVRSLQSQLLSDLPPKSLSELVSDVTPDSVSKLISDSEATRMEVNLLSDPCNTDSRIIAAASINPTLDIISTQSAFDVEKKAEISIVDIQAPVSASTFTSQPLPQTLPQPLSPPLSLSSSPFTSKFADSPLALQIAAALAADPKQTGSSSNAHAARAAFKRSLDMRVG